VNVKMGEIENSLKADSTRFHGLCHNDLFALNFMDDGKLKFIDWEFAVMGDIFYDLATLAYTFDSVGEIPTELQDYVLECYFGEVNDTLRSRMQKMKFMVLLYAVNWGLLQYGLQRAGIVPEIDGFDFREYASYMFHVIQEGKLA
jgi:thiamine kinase-like enzyme